MKWLAGLLLFIPSALFAQATNVYVTPSGAATGNCPSGTTAAPNLTVAQFNASSAWGSTTGKIGAGTTVLMCLGTATGTPGSGTGYLTFQGSGASGNPILITFDTGTIIEATYWGSGGAIHYGNNNYITVDMTNLNIKATASGSAFTGGPGTNVSTAVDMGNFTGNTLKNGTISGIYVHQAPIQFAGPGSCNGTNCTVTTATTCTFAVGDKIAVGPATQVTSGTQTFPAINPTDWASTSTTVTACSGTTLEFASTATDAWVSGGWVADLNGTQAYPIEMGGDNSNGWTNMTVQNMTVENGATCVRVAPPGGTTSSGLTIAGNTITECNHDIDILSGGAGAVLSGTNLIHDNKLSSWGAWDCQQAYANCPVFHRDGMQIGALGTGSTITGLQIYNNQWSDGANSYGIGMNALLYLTGNAGTMQATVFNNVMYHADPIEVSAGCGSICDLTGQNAYYNNTILLGRNGNNISGNVCANFDVQSGSSTGTIWENNICQTASFGNIMNSSLSSIATSDYNDFCNMGPGSFSGVGLSNNASAFVTLANWLTCVAHGCPASHDSHSTNGNPLLNTTSSPLLKLTSSSSPAYLTGTNLTSLCSTITALCTDNNGTARPSGTCVTPGVSPCWNMGAQEGSGSPVQVATPTFSPVAGSYVGTQTITITSATPSATICYTTDNSTPTANGAGTCTHGTTLTNGGTFSLLASANVQAVGSLSGDSDSAVGSAIYTINPTTGCFMGKGSVLTLNTVCR